MTRLLLLLPELEENPRREVLNCREARGVETQALCGRMERGPTLCGRRAGDSMWRRRVHDRDRFADVRTWAAAARAPQAPVWNRDEQTLVAGRAKFKGKSRCMR